jgi:hypothetical protein
MKIKVSNPEALLDMWPYSSMRARIFRDGKGKFGVDVLENKPEPKLEPEPPTTLPVFPPEGEYEGLILSVEGKISRAGNSYGYAKVKLSGTEWIVFTSILSTKVAELLDLTQFSEVPVSKFEGLKVKVKVEHSFNKQAYFTYVKATILSKAGEA